MGKLYNKKEKNGIEFIKFYDHLEELAREGARMIFEKALESEVEDFLGRSRYKRNKEFKGYRNGYCKERNIAIGFGQVAIKQPRVSDVPKDISENGFESQILSKYQRTSKYMQRNLGKLYLEGLSSGDFEPVFRAVLGDNAPLSPSSIIKLKEDWQQEFEFWQRRDLSHSRYLYLWCDGVYIKAGIEREKTALLCVLGVNENGEKELLAMGEGFRESIASWSDVFKDLKNRGLKNPLLTIGDGGLGLWGALEDVYPESKWQRCWNHKILNVMDKLPKRLQKDCRKRLREIYQAENKDLCIKWTNQYAKELRLQNHNSAADTLLRNFEHFTTFYDFPKEHWINIRTTNPIESIFSGVRNRTNVVKRFRKRENGKYMIFKIIERLSINWSKLKGKHNLEYLLDGFKFKDGILMKHNTEIKVA